MPKELSGGQKQRVAVGRALVRNPKVFLMDEPLSNLDSRLRVHMRAELKRLHRSLKTTTVYVTHDQAEAMTLSDRVVILDKGILQQEGPPLGVYSAPENIFVAGFVGSMPINLINGVIEDADGQQIFRADSLSFPLRDSDSLLRTYQPGRAIVLGVRPEDVLVYADGHGGLVDAKLEMIEHLGSDIVLHLKAGSAAIMARVAPDFDLNGRRYRVALHSKRIHVFDRETGRRL